MHTVVDMRCVVERRHTAAPLQLCSALTCGLVADEGIYAFMMAQHERLGQFSAAHALPECCCVHIAEFAESPQERVDNVKSDARALIRLIATRYLS